MTTRRAFLAIAGAALVEGAEPIYDIHQHTNYSGRTDEDLLAHQRTMGIAKTVLLPSGRRYGLAASAGGNDTALAIVRKFPGQYYFFANEMPDIPETRATLEKYLKMGAIGIGEQKFPVDCDSKPIDLIASIARDYNVPVLMHFQHQAYNLGIERFHNVLKRHPKVNFIGHAQTFWGNIDKNHEQPVMYPKTKVTPGGITDRLLADYPNMYADLSAGSGLNAFLRDEEHGRAFIRRHQDKLIYGSDCSDRIGEGAKCSGSQQIESMRKLAGDPAILRKIFRENAARIMKLG
jgi:predicted TIM-barrel fold metal-dependent hydrolase